MPFVTTFLGGSNNSQALDLLSGVSTNAPDNGVSFDNTVLTGARCWGVDIDISLGGIFSGDSISLTPGTYVVTGIVFSTVASLVTSYLSTSSTGTNGWPVQEITFAISGGNQFISAVIKVVSTETVYLNFEQVGGSGVQYAQGKLIATQIQ
jgi:hypothetical protein